MQTEQREILAAALDNLVRYSVSGCGQAARRAADLLERLSEVGEIDGDMRQMYGHLSEVLASEVDESEAPMRQPTEKLAASRAWLTWEWADGLSRLRGLAG
ncbi:MAG: hypothetical protein HY850_04810 [Betaproteobacteria bacterium]|nr:hypothetical protein [Betaproteobacteria bacterium]